MGTVIIHSIDVFEEPILYLPTSYRTRTSEARPPLFLNVTRRHWTRIGLTTVMGSVERCGMDYD
jgi:hypothetical protein